MTDPQLEPFTLRVQTLAADLPYPPTPNLAPRVIARLRRPAVPNPVPRRLALVGLALALALFVSLGVPEVRATLLNVIQIGTVRIYLIAPSATPTAASAPTGTQAPTLAATPLPTVTLLPSLLQLAGQTTLADARQNFAQTISLPTYPTDLGQPDDVFLQDFGSPMVFLVWVDPANPDQVRLVLHIIAPGGYALEKVAPTVVETASVNGQPAVWAVGPYMVQLKGNGMDIRRLIEGHVLIWKDPSGVTYRLETDQSLPEAIKIAESLR